MKKILVLSIYPAPYRAELFERFFTEFETTVFFENSGGDARSVEWFSLGNYFLLDTSEGRKEYQKTLNNIRQYDLVAIYDYSTREGVKLILRCIMNRIPYVVNSDGVMLASHGSAFRDLIKRGLLSNAQGYLASGKMAQEYFLKLGAKRENIYIHTFSTLYKEEILQKPLNSDEKRKIRRKLGLPQNKKIAIAVGRFIPLKRYFELVSEWKAMPGNCVLLLVGGGEEKEKYRNYILDNQLDNVILEDFHPKQELFEYYKASDVFVHPTRYDVWGLVVNEAMACGIPVIVSDHCVAGLELVQNEINGYVVEMGNDKKMCECVWSICTDDNTRKVMSENALKTIRSYTIEHMAETHIRVFKEILGIA